MNKKSFFWASYADLMSSLFFIMLVLFVLTVVMLQKARQATEAELEKIKETSTIPSTRIILPGEKTSLAMAAKIVPAIGK